MKPYEEQTYYELLEVPAGASAEEIRAAYQRAAEIYAPDSVALYALEDPSQAEALRARVAIAGCTGTGRRRVLPLPRSTATRRSRRRRLRSRC